MGQALGAAEAAGLAAWVRDHVRERLAAGPLRVRRMSGAFVAAAPLR